MSFISFRTVRSLTPNRSASVSIFNVELFRKTHRMIACLLSPNKFLIPCPLSFSDFLVMFWFRINIFCNYSESIHQNESSIILNYYLFYNLDCCTDLDFRNWFFLYIKSSRKFCFCHTIKADCTMTQTCECYRCLFSDTGNLIFIFINF